MSVQNNTPAGMEMKYHIEQPSTVTVRLFNEKAPRVDVVVSGVPSEPAELIGRILRTVLDGVRPYLPDGLRGEVQLLVDGTHVHWDVDPRRSEFL